MKNNPQDRKEEFIKILEEMPLSLHWKITIGETAYGLSVVRKMEGNEDATMEAIERYNLGVIEWEKGYADAIARIKDWRNEQYLKLKNLK